MPKMNIKKIVDGLKIAKGFDRVLKKVDIKTLENGKLIAVMKVDDDHLNTIGGLHGGLSATLVDSLSTFALMSHKHGGVPSVSVDLNLTFMKGAKLGDEIEISANTLRTGRTLAFLEVFIKNNTTGQLMVRGSHTKFLLTKK